MSNTPQPQIPMAPGQGLDQLTQQLLQRTLQPPSKLPAPSPAQPMDRVQPQYGARTPGEGKEQFLYNLGATIHNSVAALKEEQTRKALAHWETLQNAYDRAEMQVQSNQQLQNASPDQRNAAIAQQIAQDPIAGPLLRDPKVIKQMYKTLNQDILNPKPTVYGEALKRLQQAEGAKGKVEKLRDLMTRKKQQPQMDQAQQAQFGQQMAQRLAASAVPQRVADQQLIGLFGQIRQLEQNQNQNALKLAEMEQTGQYHNALLAFDAQKEQISTLRLQLDNLKAEQTAKHQTAQEQLGERRATDYERRLDQLDAQLGIAQKHLELAEGKAQQKLSGIAMGRAAAADSALRLLPDIMKQVQAAAAHIGPVIGRAQQMSGIMYTNVRQLNAALYQIYAIGSAAHGWRSIMAPDEFAKNTGSIITRPQELLAGLGSLTKSLQSIAAYGKAQNWEAIGEQMPAGMKAPVDILLNPPMEAPKGAEGGDANTPGSAASIAAWKASQGIK